MGNVAYDRWDYDSLWEVERTTPRFGKIDCDLMREFAIPSDHLGRLGDALFFADLAFHSAKKEITNPTPLLPIRGTLELFGGVSRPETCEGADKSITDRALGHLKKARDLMLEFPENFSEGMELAFDTATGGKRGNRIKRHESGIVETLPRSALLSLPDILTGMNAALETAQSRSRKQRGNPGKTRFAERACITPLHSFWTRTLDRRFSPKFEATHVEEPVNEESRFCLNALRSLIGGHVTGSTCKYLMGDVIRRHRRLESEIDE